MTFSSRFGPWALVTGAANGLGAAFAAELVRRDVSVLALDRDGEALDRQARRLRSDGLGATAEVESVVLDLGEPGLERRVTEAVGEREVGLLINNAAISNAAGFFEQDLESLRAAQRVNCDAPLILTHVLGKAMMKRRRGGIVLVSSLTMLVGAPLFAHYAATKAFDAVLAEGLFEELRGAGVTATTVLGPLMDTPGYRATAPTGPAPPPIATERVAAETLDALGRKGRVVVGREGFALAHVMRRLVPHERLRRLVGDNIRRMYPGRA